MRTQNILSEEMQTVPYGVTFVSALVRVLLHFPWSRGNKSQQGTAGSMGSGVALLVCSASCYLHHYGTGDCPKGAGNHSLRRRTFAKREQFQMR